jgi:two-component system LytT family sensor kinase
VGSSGTRRRQFFAVSAGAFTASGVLRGCGLLFAGTTAPKYALNLFSATVSITWFWVPVASFVIASRRWRLSRRQFAALHSVALIAVVFIEPLWSYVVLRAVRWSGNGIPYVARLIGRLDTNLLFYGSILAVAWAVDHLRRHDAARVAAAKLETALADAELHLLTLQLHPHFLFNTLNLVSQLAYRDLGAARRMLANLRALLVQSLAHAMHREIPMGDELRFLEAYLAIQQRRFGDRLRASVVVDDAALGAAVPHLVLQPLVENAILHGIGGRGRGGNVGVRATVAAGRVVVTIEDDGVGLSDVPVREGLGLSNTRMRLRRLYAGDFELTVGVRATGGAVTRVVMPLRPVTTVRDLATDDASVETPAGDEASKQARGMRRLPVSAQVVVAWTGIAILWTELDSATRLMLRAPLAWGESATSSVLNALVWMAITPAVLWLTGRLERSDMSSIKRLAVHIAAAVTASVAHVAMWFALLDALLPSEIARERGNRGAWLVWDLAAYATIVAFGLGSLIAARHRDSLVAIATSRARLARARVASMRLRLQPTTLLAGIDAIDRAMGIDAGRAESEITRVGDELRELLASAEREDAVA